MSAELATATAVYLPGEYVVEAEERKSSASKDEKIILGPGLREINERIVAIKAGKLNFRTPNIFWIDNYQKRYIPVRGDAIVGVVTARSGDIFRVDISAYEQASLSYLAFEGATKKNRPDVCAGDLVYAKLINASKDIEPELTCVNSQGKKQKLGALQKGFVFNCSINLVRKILRPKCPLLNALKREVAFEVAIGMNGKIWIRGKTTRETIAIGNAILAAEMVSDEKIVEICENIGNILFALS